MIQDITDYNAAQRIPAPFTAPDTRAPLREALEAIPGVRWVSIGRSTLGGEYRASLSINPSLDARDDWRGGIFNNSRHILLSVEASGDVSCLTKCYTLPKFRGGKSKDHAHMVARVRKWVEACNAGKA